MIRILSRQILAAGTGTMVKVMRALNLVATAAAAKTAEQAMALTGMVFMGILGETILFRITRALRGRYAFILGLVRPRLGNRRGVSIELISYRVGQTTSTRPGLNAVLVFGVVLLWGASLGWAIDNS